jgi:hypothetical protein
MMKKTVLLLLVASSYSAAVADSSADAAAHLRAIRSIGPEGRGNAEAFVAWKVLAVADVSSLLSLLEAMDGANDYSLNWLRAAVDSIVSRELKAGGAMPVAELGKFLLDTRHHPRARKLSFDLIARVQPVTAEKLLPGLLNDPSMELRHDAVEQIVLQGNRLVAETNQAGAILLYQQALNHARDAQQVETIATNLVALGQPVDLLKHFGFLANWKVIGPFDNTGNKGFEHAYPPEQRMDFAAEYEGKKGNVRWQDYATKHPYGMVDMNQPCGKLKEVLAYAATDFYSDQARAVELRLGGKNSWKIWLNGRLVFGRDEYHTMTEIDQYPMRAELQAGRNTILVKVCQNEQVEEWTEEWEFQLRITDSLGTPIVSAKADSASVR